MLDRIVPWFLDKCNIIGPAPSYVYVPLSLNPRGRCQNSDRANGRASASGAGGRGFDPGPRHTKGVKNGTSGYFAWCSAL